MPTSTSRPPFVLALLVAAAASFAVEACSSGATREGVISSTGEESVIGDGRGVETRGGGGGFFPRRPYVLTQHNDNARTGANLDETILDPSTVSATTFGKVFERDVVGNVFAQPLYVSSAIGSTNVVYVATEANQVYAFDADDPAASKALWHADLGPAVPSEVVQCANTGPTVGVTATPVIDLATGTMYLTSETYESFVPIDQGPGPAAVIVVHLLHALDITTGAERPGSPVVIRASVPGTGAGSAAGVVRFDPKLQLQRPGIVLTNGHLYLGFGANCDRGNYHGWVLGYDAATLRQTDVFNTTPDGWQGGIWQSGNGIAADRAGDLYVMTGNGSNTTSSTMPPGEGDEALRLTHDVAGNLVVGSRYVPSDPDLWEADDADLGSSGPMLLPLSDELAGGGKDGTLHVWSREDLSVAAQDLVPNPLTSAWHSVYGAPVYWAAGGIGRLFVWREDDAPRAFTRSGSVFDPIALIGAYRADLPTPDKGANLSISANGHRHGSGILWAAHIASSNEFGTLPAELMAFDAESIDRRLWASGDDPRDDPGVVSKFGVPTVAGGKVYLGTLSNKLVVYGLLPTPRGSADAGAADASASVLCGDPGPPQPTTWSYVFSTYFSTTPLPDGTATLGHCGDVTCHGAPAGPGGTPPAGKAGFAIRDGASASGVYDDMVSFGLIRKGTTTSWLGNPSTSPLAWFGAGGNMPWRGPGGCNARAGGAVYAWSQAGAPGP